MSLSMLSCATCGNRVLANELTRIESASAMAAAKRSGRIPDAREFLDQFDAMSRSPKTIFSARSTRFTARS
ncbi:MULTISPECIES: hypothetical protein [Amycolatopsis]|uniref:hypothetical protein n=1 Tax=Amycolatopsis TaxID=1813 RepID=UPI0008298520|nr:MULTISPECIES: hypothetical protein [Amycolatopsis]